MSGEILVASLCGVGAFIAWALLDVAIGRPEGDFDYAIGIAIGIVVGLLSSRWFWSR